MFLNSKIYVLATVITRLKDESRWLFITL